MTKASMNPYLRDFWRTKSRYKVLYGGRASSKTWDAAAFCVFLAQGYKVRIVCARQFQNKISESVYATIVEQIDRFGLRDQFDVQKTTIIHKITGAEFLFYGIARNINELKGLEGIDLLWLEEAEAITEEAYNVLEATIRKEGSQILIVFNPKFAQDFVYRNFVTNPPPDCTRMQINYNNNPFLSSTAKLSAENMKERDYELYQHIYLGVPLSDDDRVIIKRRWLEAAVDAHIKLGITPTGQHRIGFDVADDGEDANATVHAHGVLAKYVTEWRGNTDELVDTAYKAANIAIKTGATIYYDPIGVGAGVGSNIKQYNALNGTRVEYVAWNAGGKIIDPDNEYTDGKLNKDMFSNAKSQAWWLIGDRLRETYNAVVNGKPYDPNNIISISSDIENREKLITELSTPYKDMDATGKAKVESKKDLAKRDVKSPNLADAFVMAYAPQERRAHMWAGAV